MIYFNEIRGDSSDDILRKMVKFNKWKALINCEKLRNTKKRYIAKCWW